MPWHIPSKRSLNIHARLQGCLPNRPHPATRDLLHLTSPVLREYKLTLTAQAQQNWEGKFIT